MLESQELSTFYISFLVKSWIVGILSNLHTLINSYIILYKLLEILWQHTKSKLSAVYLLLSVTGSSCVYMQCLHTLVLCLIVLYKQLARMIHKTLVSFSKHCMVLFFDYAYVMYSVLSKLS